MCGRYGFTATDKEISEHFDVESWEFDIRDSYNVAPTQEMPVIERHSPNSLHLRKWGVQPIWSKAIIINATIEKLTTSNLWKKPLSENRVIVPARWFYEWKRNADGSKQPYVFRLKTHELFGFAGLLLNYKDKEGIEREGYVIITTQPNSLMEQYHDRFGAILRKENYEEWLNPDNVEPEKLLKLLDPYDSDLMEAYPISSLVNKVSNNFPEILEPVRLD